MKLPGGAKLRIGKRVRLAPLVHANLSPSKVSLSLGGGGLSLNVPIWDAKRKAATALLRGFFGLPAPEPPLAASEPTEPSEPAAPNPEDAPTAPVEPAVQDRAPADYQFNDKLKDFLSQT